MMLKVAVACLFLASLTLANPIADAAKEANASGVKLWALIIAGSNTFMNYRHQADVCHSYHVLHSHGIPDERIVVMMYDDIANNRQNPDKGTIINHINGPNVYKGVPKDYTAETVTPANFLKVLQGDKKAMNGIGSGKVIESGPKDHVFVYFADHGAPGLIAFPDDELHARPLNAAIKKMHSENRYAKMVFYVEACESGSMFHKLLPKNINVFATTAADPNESSYACYFDSQLNTYLGDVYSVKWLENSDKENIEKLTLQEQFKIVKEETTTSHVMEYGDLKIGALTVGEFQGLKNANKSYATEERPINDAVDARDVPVFIEANKLKTAKTQTEKESIFMALNDILEKRLYMIRTFQEIFNMAREGQGEVSWDARPELNNFDCYEKAVQLFNTKCFRISEHVFGTRLGSLSTTYVDAFSVLFQPRGRMNEYSLAYLHKFVTLCEHNVSVEKISIAIDRFCDGPKTIGTI